MRPHIAVIMLSLLLPAALATTYPDLTLPEMAERTDLAFFATVESVSVEEREGEPWTRVTFAVEQALQGELDDRLELLFYGGSLPGGEALNVLGMPHFTTGEQVLILAYDAPYYSPIVGFSQGLWRLSGQGLRDERGRVLSLSEDGELLLDGPGAGTQDLLAAMEALLEEAP